MSADTYPGMDPAVVAEVQARLDHVAAEHRVTILFAIESGSRAWGFPSPDSDYDCRFLYLRSSADYLALYPPRDVIETPLTPVFDVNGWDLPKALRLMLKGNAVIVEWLTSPIVYRAIAGVRADLLALAGQVVDRARVGRHYLHLAERQRSLFLTDPSAVALKKVFYVLRPALALRWLRLRPEARIAPMHFPTLCAETELSADIAGQIAELLARKAQSREMGKGAMPAALTALVHHELEMADALHPRSDGIDPAAIAAADAAFHALLSLHTGPAISP